MGKQPSQALDQYEGPEGAHALRVALRELPLDGATALAIVAQLARIEGP